MKITLSSINTHTFINCCYLNIHAAHCTKKGDRTAISTVEDNGPIQSANKEEKKVSHIMYVFLYLMSFIIIIPMIHGGTFGVDFTNRTMW
jgi:hypothetical protein